MKIVCESCGAKYSIADEKVAGKVFKIRCKKCSAVIVVKGDQPSTASAGAAPAIDDGGDAAWHVVVSGEQQGPFAPRQIGELLAEGKIDWEAYVWREGMEGWQPAKDVPALVSSVMAESESGDAAKATSAAQPHERFGGSGDMGADPFASADDGGLSGVIGQQPVAASASPVGGGADLFASSARGAFAAAADDDDEPHGVGPGARVSGGQAMTGQRNENSVLFSLSNLQALATGSGGASPSAPKAGMAAGEGSGLIDIRALATATQPVADRPAAGGRDKVEDLLAVGSTGTTFSATSLAAPVAVEKRDSSKAMVYGMGGAIVMLIAAVAFLVLRSSSDAPTTQLTTPQDPNTPAAAATGATGTAATPPTTPSTAPQAAEPSPSAAAPDQQPEEAREPDREEEEGRERSGSSRDRSRRRDRKDDSSPTAAATPAPEPEAPAKKPTGDRSLDDLLEGALGGKGGARPAAKPAASENLPQTPSREDVLSAMKGVTPKVQGCGGGQSGVATAKVSVAGPSGKVSNVDVTGQFAGTPVASCVSKEVAKAKFNKFQQATFTFSFPFKI